MDIFKSVILMSALILKLAHCNRQNVETISKIVSDIIQNENVLSHLSAFTCWPNVQSFRFVKSINYPVQISSQFEIGARLSDALTNKLWYFIDMRCERSVSFLHQIDAEYFAHPYRWILYEPNFESLQNLTFLTDSNVILINANAKRNQFDLMQSKSW